MKKILMGSMMALLVLSAGSCKKGEKMLRFAIVPKMRDNPVFNYAKIAAEVRAKELKGIEILWRGPEEADPAKQVSVIEALIAEGVDGISVSCNEPNSIAPAIDKGIEKGIPVICFDSDSPKSKRKYFYGTNDAKGGAALGERMSKLLDGKGRICILSGYQGAFNLENRIKGAKEYLARNAPGIKIEHIYYCNDDAAEAIRLIEAHMSKDRDLNGWLMVGGWPLFASDALKSIDPKKTKVVAFDALQAEWQYIENGKCQGLIAQNLWGWGYESVNILKSLVDKQSVTAGPEGFIEAPVELVTQENLEQYKKSWKERFGNN